MARLFVASQDLDGAQLTLTGDPYRYLARVLRLNVGGRVDLFDGRGLEIAATIARIGSRDVTLTLGERRHAPPRATPPVTLLMGLPRPERMDLVVQKATELGAARVVPVRTARSASGQEGRPDRWERIAREAARQCGRADIPDISPVVALGEAVAALEPTAARLCPWEEAPGAEPLGRSIPDAPSGVAVLIGPEGGLTVEEVALVTGAAFKIVTLGPRILRTETAAIATLAIVQSQLGALDPARDFF